MKFPDHVLGYAIKSRRNLFIILVLLSFLRFVLAFIFPVYGDACKHFTISKSIAHNPSLVFESSFIKSTDFSLFHLVGALVYLFTSLFGPDVAEYSLKLISPIFGSATIPLTYFIAKKIFNENIALISALFLAASPFHLIFSSIGYVESLLIFLSVLSFSLLLRGLENMSKKNMAFCGIAVGLTGLTKPTGILIFLGIVLYLTLAKRDFLRKYPKEALVLFVIALTIGSLWHIVNFNQIVLGYVLTNQQPLNMRVVAWTVFIPVFLRAYYEYWGVWDMNERVWYFFSSDQRIFALFIGFTLIISFLSWIHVAGFLRCMKSRSSVLLHAWIIPFILFAFWWATTLILRGWSLYSIGFRSPLAPTLPVLAIYAGYGITFISRKQFCIKKKIKVLLPLQLILICLGLLVVATVAEASYFNQYYGRLRPGFTWVKNNTPMGAIILTSMPDEVRYYADRATLNLRDMKPESITVDVLIKLKVSYIFVPYRQYHMAQLSEHLEKIMELKRLGFLKEVYRDDYVLIFKINC